MGTSGINTAAIRVNWRPFAVQNSTISDRIDRAENAEEPDWKMGVNC